MAEKPNSALRKLPSVSSFLGSAAGNALSKRYGEGLLKFALRRELERLRAEIKGNGRKGVPKDSELAQVLEDSLERICSPSARSAVNATGTLLHTNLGRAALGKEAREAVEASCGFGVVQVNLADNSRSKRDETIVALLKELTSCEAATVVNNNAAATFMILNVLASGREVVLSRGQMVEIGGSFRMPDVMEQSGAILREVGTTNRTHLYDYERAITESTAALLYVEPSNYAVEGFSSTPSLAELCELGRNRDIPVIADLGSGALVSMTRYGVKDTLTITAALKAGAAITCSSGDKLIGGPQAGVICGNSAIVGRIRKSPFARMFRVDKLTLAGLEATLAQFVAGSFESSIPLYQMLSCDVEDLEKRAKDLVTGLGTTKGSTIEICDSTAYVGGGTLPREALASKAVAISSNKGVDSFAENVAKKLRLGFPPIFCRIQDEKIIFDMRSLLEGDLELLVQSIPPVIKQLL